LSAAPGTEANEGVDVPSFRTSQKFGGVQSHEIGANCAIGAKVKFAPYLARHTKITRRFHQLELHRPQRTIIFIFPQKRFCKDVRAPIARAIRPNQGYGFTSEVEPTARYRVSIFFPLIKIE
jgi:hypothetical protein